jgi:cytochrome c553
VAPRLAGQFAAYLEAQMGAFARGERAKSKTMTLMMKSLDAGERARIAKYLASL